MAILRANFPDLLEEKFREISFGGYERYEELYSKIFNVMDSSKDNEHFSGLSGLAMPYTKAESSDMTYDDPVQLYDVTARHDTYAQGVKVSMEAMDDDQYGLLGDKVFNSMGRGFKERVETNAWNVLNNGFTTQLSADGIALFSASHPRNPEDATTHANKPATDADLSVSSLKAAITNFENTLDHRGLKMRLIPRVLVVPTALRFTAEEILKSDKEPYVNENQTNVLKGEGLRILTVPYLTDSDAWFLIAEKADHDLIFLWRRKFTVKRDSEFNSWDAKFGGIMRFSTVVVDWRGTYGTQGA